MKVINTFFENLKGAVTFLMLFAGNASTGQGIINNGANITLANNAYIYVAGGAATGNFTNQDAGAFTGTVSNAGTIDVTGDWINNSAGNVFDASTGTVELVGSNNQDIKGTTETYFNNLSLLGTNTKTLGVRTLTGGGFAAPAGVLAVNARTLDLNGHTLEVKNPAVGAITRTTGYIISETNAGNNSSIIQWNVGAGGTYVFPFGVSAAVDNYIPLTLTISSGNTTISASTRITLTSNNQPWQPTVNNMYSAIVPGAGEIPVVIDRWWDISSPATFNAAVSFTYRGIENTTTYSPTGTFAAQNWSGALWFPPVGGGPGITLSGTANVSFPDQGLGGTIATPWVLSNITAPLPVELLSFTAQPKNENVAVAWSTASEINSDYFQVEKSADGYAFENVEKKDAAGNSTSLLHYDLMDEYPLPGLSYYRLKQVDRDGSFTYSRSIAVYINNRNRFDIINVSVNDAGIANLMFADNTTEACTVTVYDMLGKELHREQVTATTGLNLHEVNMVKFSRGIYYVSICNNEKSRTRKIMY